MRNMKKQSSIGIWLVLSSIVMMAFQLPLMAQASIEAVSGKMASWMQKNWLVIAGGILLVILLATAAGSKTKKTGNTTEAKDDVESIRTLTANEIEN